jgi:hypothetical protein
MIIVVEAVIISVCAVAAVQIATANGGNIWYCGPILLIAAFECLRYPLSSWMAQATFLGRLLSAFVLMCVAVLTFEGVTLAIEQFMNQRVITVMDVQAEVDKADRELASAQANADAVRAEEERLTQEVNQRRLDKEKIAATTPPQAELPKPQVCKGRHGTSYNCTPKGITDIIKQNRQAEEDHERQVKQAEQSLAAAEMALEKSRVALEASTSVKAQADAVTEGKKHLERVMLQSPMHRSAAAWFDVPVKDLSERQFQTFKKWAMYGLAGAAATATMFASFVASLPSGNDNPSKLGRALRAYLGRRRKSVVRVVTKIVEIEKPVEKAVTQIVDKVIEIPKYVFVPVKDGYLVDADGSHGEPISSLRSIAGGKP